MNTTNPELQRLLASLRGSNSGLDFSTTFGNAASDASSLPSKSTPQNIPDSGIIPGLGIVPPAAVIDSASRLGSNESRPSDPRLNKGKPQPRQLPIPTAPATPPVPPVADSPNITTWSSAIKHIQKHILPNDQVTSRIKHLINEQHKHEEQWWKQRQEIVTRHAGRAGNQEKVAGLLQELGGLAAPMVKVDEAADRNELEVFDQKVYKSLLMMVQNFDGQLKKLGLPFFTVKHELVLKGGDEWSEGNLDKGELRELQKKMLQYLEDLLMD